MIGNTHRIKFTIANGESESEARDLQGYIVSAIFMPAAWTAASLTVLAATDENGTYLPVFDDAGVQVEIVTDAGRAVGVDIHAAILASLRWVKLKSCAVGTPATAVNQGAARTLELLTKV